MCESIQITGQYATVNGIKLYYQRLGTPNGDTPPLILLHGGIGAIEMFGEVLSALAAEREVIGVDLQSHGRTPAHDRPMRYETMADDIAHLIEHLGLAHADVMGYSLGGGVALQTAIRHPNLVRKLVVVSTPYARQGWYPEVQTGQAQMGAAMAEQMKPTPMYELYAKIAPHVEDWPRLLDDVGDMLRMEYDWAEDVAAMTVPTLIVIGDADSVSPAHAAQFFALLGGGQRDAGWDGANRPASRLAILPGETHYTIFVSPAMLGVVTPFLDAP